MLGQILVTKQTGPQGKIVSKVREVHLKHLMLSDMLKTDCLHYLVIVLNFHNQLVLFVALSSTFWFRQLKHICNQV